MSDKTIENRIDAKILEEAASYYLSLQDDTMSGPELKAWQAWFMRSKDHQLAFRRLEALWGMLDGVAETDMANLQSADIAGDNSAAAPLAGGSVIGLVAPASTAAARPAPQRWYMGIAASFAAVLIAGYMVLAPEAAPNRVPATPYFTEAGAQRIVRLADGSIVELGSDSRIAVDYTPTERKLALLRGEAVFTVAKDANRPFVVRAGSGSVTAIGTVFNVRRTPGDVRVRVLEGTVAVRPQSEEAAFGASIEDVAALTNGTANKAVALVTAGSQTSYSEAGTLAAVEVADVQAGLAWRTGVLTLVDRELSDVIREVNRYVQTEVAIGDSAIGDFRFTGTVYPDKLDEWLDGLAQGYPLKVVRVSGRTILLLDDTATTH